MARHRRAYTGERYTASLRVQLTPSQRAALAQEAASCGVPTSDLVRAKLTGGRLPQPAMGTDRQSLRSLTAQLAHLGNNLNQLAHIANQTGRIRSEESLAAVTTAIIATLRKVIGA